MTNKNGIVNLVYILYLCIVLSNQKNNGLSQVQTNRTL